VLGVDERGDGRPYPGVGHCVQGTVVGRMTQSVDLDDPAARQAARCTARYRSAIEPVGITASVRPGASPRRITELADKACRSGRGRAPAL